MVSFTYVYFKIYFILLLILRSSLTKGACAQYLEANFPKNLLLFGKIGEYKLSLGEYKLSLCFLGPMRGGRNFTTFLGKSFLVCTFLGKILFSPVSVPLSKYTTVFQDRSRVRFPLVQCRSVFSCVWLSPVGLSWISWAFVLRFRSSACAACVYHSFECTFGPTVARSISPASVALSFYVSVLLNVPHASMTLWPHCRSVGLSVPFEKGSSGSFGFASTVAR